ncbi:MAG TPA: triose-phosphate isomerase [Candidatus Dormibacteraeota bacterium]|jgi:triosephosphate isomerase|nr:triose-phosphate isomerase [Candidatus Dormibacteraeota bacterium]
MRKKLIAGNWKMYKTPEQAKAFVSAFLTNVAGHTRDEIVLCPPFVSIPAAVEATRDSNIGVGGQDMFWEKEGAYTGAVCAQMLHAVGCTHVIIGHSERRQYFCETDDTVNHKLRAALVVGLKPIVCVGEVLQEREAGVTEDILRRQCGIAFREIAAAGAHTIIVAYEPVWAIGTGKTATPELAAEAHRVIRAEAAEAFGEPVAAKMRILYGGSVKPENATALMSRPEIDGALVGGASLDPKSFAAIVKW